ncbi:hypothetical protein LTR08_004454 [Meristemomyces frigidus]|nr:hypothetical protein LTR08_004454 [Meristemomyces frigidus]
MDDPRALLRRRSSRLATQRRRAHAAGPRAHAAGPRAPTPPSPTRSATPPPRRTSQGNGTPVRSRSATGDLTVLPPSTTRAGAVYNRAQQPAFLRAVGRDARAVEVVREISLCFDEGGEVVAALSEALAARVEGLGLLRGYAAVVVAVACVFFAAGVVEGGGFAVGVVASVLEERKEGCISAFNELWFQRDRFRGVVREHGGDMAGLPDPVAVSSWDDGFRVMARYWLGKGLSAGAVKAKIDPLLPPGKRFSVWAVVMSKMKDQGKVLPKRKPRKSGLKNEVPLVSPTRAGVTKAKAAPRWGWCVIF